jgi:hypothetical protein
MMLFFYEKFDVLSMILQRTSNSVKNKEPHKAMVYFCENLFVNKND